MQLAYLWFCVVLVMGAIFYFSSLPAKKIPRLFPFEDIVFHSLAFGLLAYCFSRAVANTFTGLITAQLVLYSILFCTAYGISDEYHQLFVAGRCCSGMDIFIDGAGGFFGSLFHRL